MEYTDTDRLEFLIEKLWSPPSKFGGKSYPGRWTEHDGRGCDDPITPEDYDPRRAIDLALDLVRNKRGGK